MKKEQFTICVIYRYQTWVVAHEKNKNLTAKQINVTRVKDIYKLRLQHNNNQYNILLVTML